MIKGPESVERFRVQRQRSSEPASERSESSRLFLGSRHRARRSRVMQLRQVEDHIVGVGVLEAMRTLQTSFCPFGGGRISESGCKKRCDSLRLQAQAPPPLPAFPGSWKSEDSRALLTCLRPALIGVTRLPPHPSVPGGLGGMRQKGPSQRSLGVHSSGHLRASCACLQLLFDVLRT